MPEQAFPELDIEGVPVPVREPAAPEKPAQTEAEAESVRAAVAFGRKSLRTVTIPGELLEGLSGEERLAAARRIAYQMPVTASNLAPYPGPLVVPLGGADWARPKDDALFIPAQDVMEYGAGRWELFCTHAVALGLTVARDVERNGYILRRK